MAGRRQRWEAPLFTVVWAPGSGMTAGGID